LRSFDSRRFAQTDSVVAESVGGCFLNLGLNGNFYGTAPDGGGAGSIFPPLRRITSLARIVNALS
jgi:hypothetical protein